jgi:hypothetical protein
MRLIQTFRRLSKELLLGMLTQNFCRSMIFWMGSVRPVHNAFGLAIICLRRFTVILMCLRVGPLFFIADIKDVLDIFENVRVLVLAYADNLKLYLRVNSTDNYRLFQQDLNRLQG